MAWIKHSSQVKILAGLLALGLVVNPSSLVVAQHPSSSLSGKLPTQWEFDPPGNPGVPGGREGGASRGPDDCIKRGKEESKEKLIALIPTSGVGVTVSKYPTFYWYLPPTNAKSMYFVLSDENDQEVYKTTLTLAPNQSGFMSLQLPTNFPTSSPLNDGLKAGKQYKWDLALVCIPSEPSADVTVTGIVQVGKSPFLLVPSRSDNASLQMQLALYAKSHIWYDALNTLAELHRSNPNDAAVTDAWTKLLKSVALEKIAQEPMVIQSASIQLEGFPEQQTNNLIQGTQAK